MNRFIVLTGLGAAISLSVSFAYGQEIETFDNPDTLQVGNTAFAFTPPNSGSFSAGSGAVLTNHPTYYEIANPNGGYGTAYKSIYASDKPPAGGSNGVIDISGSTTLQFDVTISSGDMGPFVDLQDGEGDQYQYFMGYGLTGTASADVPLPGETITQGASANEIIIDYPLQTPEVGRLAGQPAGDTTVAGYYDLGGTGTFDFTSIVNFRLEDDPGTAPSYDISLNDLSAVTVPEPASLSIAAIAGLLLTGRRRQD